MTSLTLPIRLDPNCAPNETLHVTASGLPVRIYATDGGGKYPIHGAVYTHDRWEPRSWLDGGKYEMSGGGHDFDLRDRAPAKRGVWVARWLSHLGTEYVTCHDTREGASEPSIYPAPKLLSVTYCADGDGLDTPADPPLVVDWAKLPDWAEWAAADEDGEVWGFDKKPEEGQASWFVGANYRCAEISSSLYRLAPGFKWRDTLIRRPEDV